MSGCVHGRSWILSGVLYLQILTLTRNIRTIKRIPLSDTLGGVEGGGRGRGKGRGGKRRERGERGGRGGRRRKERRREGMTQGEAIVQLQTHTSQLPLK